MLNCCSGDKVISVQPAIFARVTVVFSLCADSNTSRHVVNSGGAVTTVLLVAVYYSLDHLFHHHGLCLVQGHAQTY